MVYWIENVINNKKEDQMITTYFRPSIHGWPFGNSWTKSFVFDAVTLPMGFCGGMCWRALQRFYNGIPIPRDTPQPVEGDPLYNEIWEAQVNSLPSSTMWKIFEWQSSPDLDHLLNIDSLGKRTQEAWPAVKASLDASKPITITLIASSNDINPVHLKDNHRVVAYAYEIDAVAQGGGAPEGADSKITIWIYDPKSSYYDKDDVKLTFYLGAEDSKIRLRHSGGDEYHGFFKDDKDRNYESSDATYVRIDKCEQTGISSANRADYALKFSWQCRFIPYFTVIVDDGNWKYNKDTNQARSQYEPVDKDHKQCPATSGSLTVNLLLPRDTSTVAVRLLDDNTYYQSVGCDARPTFDCYPYIHSRSAWEVPCVCDYDTKDEDLFIKEADPSDDAVQELDTSTFRWVMHVPHKPIGPHTSQEDLTTTYLEMYENKRLGNIKIPIFANFEERNLAAPTVKSGVVKTVINGVVVNTTTITALTDKAQKIFDGFQNNPADYNNDTRIEFTYQSKDYFGVIVEGQAIFYGKSILYDQFAILISVFDPSKLVKAEAIARELVNRAIVDVVIKSPHLPDPQPPSTDPVILLNKVRDLPKLQSVIKQAFQSSWGNPSTLIKIREAQSVILKQADIGETIPIDIQDKPGTMLNTTKILQEKQQREFDAVALNIAVTTIIDELEKDPNFTSMLDLL
jgi:hypothetical protein